MAAGVTGAASAAEVKAKLEAPAAGADKHQNGGGVKGKIAAFLGEDACAAAIAARAIGRAGAEPSAKQGRAVPLLILSHPACVLHNLPGHIERPQRVTAIMEALRTSGLLPPSAFHDESGVPRAGRELLELFHTKKHVDRLFQLFKQSAHLFASGGGSGVRDIDADTAVMPHTEEAALRAAGAACLAVDRVLAGEADSAFCVVRPPGHHATPSKAMGFCFFNNAGIAALHARAKHGLTRVACVDVDVHHGNGTQDFFEGDENLFYASTHMGYGQYPGTGFENETGVAGNIVNVPLHDGDGSDKFRRAYEDKILPKLRDLKPELIIMSTGFDAHGDDPIGELELTPEDFHWVTKKLVEVGQECGGAKVVSVLEGGYDLGALAACSLAHVRALLGKEFSVEPEEEAAAAAAAAAEEEEEAREEEELVEALAHLATTTTTTTPTTTKQEEEESSDGNHGGSGGDKP